MMSIEIQKMMLDKGYKKVDIATRCGWSQSNFGNKLKRDNFTEKELEAIATALGMKLEIKFLDKE